jgi:hypothetical protein
LRSHRLFDIPKQLLVHFRKPSQGRGRLLCYVVCGHAFI